MRKEHNVLTHTGAVCPIAEQIYENTDTSKVVEEIDFMCLSDSSKTAMEMNQKIQGLINKVKHRHNVTCEL